MAVCKLHFVIQHTQVFCLGVFIAAIAAKSAINEVEEIEFQRGGAPEYEDSNDYSSAALGSIITSSTAIALQIILIFTRCCYMYSTTKVKRFFLHEFMVSL